MANTNQNHLESESSPYLLQHAENPVNWYPWSEEAFKKAHRENKPVFVSIGYATCHWCHVMAHESFEDNEVAKLMNSTFINIKVDREERPDIDNTYMLVCQMLTGSGGWPLNVFLTPQKKPFYAATYIPKRGRQGRPGMLELIPWISQLWENEQEKIANSSQEIVNAFQKSNTFESGKELTADILDQAYRQYTQSFDEEYGGFGTSPKFPSSHNLMLLLRYARQNPDSNALAMVEKTLIQMRLGGIFDHIGLGFHRYSTDRKWLVPHFEKMLYDQAMLLIAYTEAWQLTKNDFFNQTAHKIAQYVLTKMQDEKGGFYSAEDADSEGEEGKFYIWSNAEINEILTDSEAAFFIDLFNLTERGNYRDEASGQQTGKNIPYLQKPMAKLAQERGMKEDEIANSMEAIRQKLFRVRKERIHPLLDDKILTDWNGLMIAALAKAGRVFQNEKYIDQAQECWNFISTNLFNNQDELKHRYRKENVAINAHADDYAFQIWGLTELYDATKESDYLAKAVSLNKRFIDQFWDEENGGFYFTSESGEQLLGRKKEIHDGALPSANSVAMMNLLRLGRLTGNTEWERMVDKVHKLFSTDIQKAPTGFGFALQSVDFIANDTREIIIAGKKKDPSTKKMFEILRDHFLPNTVVLLNDPDDDKIKKIVPYLSDFKMRNDTATAYVCENYSCEQPTNKPRVLRKMINE